MGPVSEAAGLLFSEFNRLGVLQSQMFVKDPSFAARRKLGPDPAILHKFDIAIIQPLKERIVREVGYGLSVEGASAAALVKSMQAARS